MSAGNRRGQGKKSQPARASKRNAAPAPEAEGTADERAISETGVIDAVSTEHEPEPETGADPEAVEELSTEAAPETETLAETLADDATPIAATPDGGGLHPVSQIAPAMHDGELDRAKIKQGLESLIFVSDRIVSAAQLARSIKVRAAIVRELIAELMTEYQGRGIELIEVAGGYQFRSAAACAPFVRDFVAQKPVRLTRAQLETLALVCYRQPITRPEIDDVRGVDSGSAIRVLLERNLIKMIGRKDEPGRPLLYGTSAHFLEFFGMKSLKDLPTLREFTELSDENRALFKRKTGEDVESAEADLAAAEELARSDDEDAEAHISDEDLAALAAEAARDELAQQNEGIEDGTGESAEQDDEEPSGESDFGSERLDEEHDAAHVDPE